jgi:hypothetical protein
VTSTTAKVYKGAGYFVDFSQPLNPILTYTTWEEQTFTDTFATTNLRTAVGICSDGLVSLFADKMTSAQRRDYIQIGLLTHIDGATITNVNLIPTAVTDMGGKMHDMCEAIGFVNLEGNVYSGAAATTGANNLMKKTAGKSFACDRNYATDKEDMNVTQRHDKV